MGRRRRGSVLEQQLEKLADAVERADPDRGDRRGMRRIEDFRAIHQAVLELRQYRLARRPLPATPRFWLALLATIGALAIALFGVLRIETVRASLDATVEGLTFEVPDGPSTLALLPAGARLERLTIGRASSLSYPTESGSRRLRESEGEPLRDIVLRAGEGMLGVKHVLARGPSRLALETGPGPWSMIASAWGDGLDLELQVGAGAVLEVSTADGEFRSITLAPEVGIVEILAGDVEGLALEWSLRVPVDERAVELIQDVVPADQLAFVRGSEPPGSRSSTVLEGAVVLPSFGGESHALRAPQRLLGEQHGHMLALLQEQRALRLWWEGRLTDARIGTAVVSQDVMPTRLEALIGDEERQLLFVATFYFALLILSILRGSALSTLKSISPSLPED